MLKNSGRSEMDGKFFDRAVAAISIAFPNQFRKA